ncbi:leucine-rich repeat domain-containing protein [Rhodoflexus sp.]
MNKKETCTMKSLYGLKYTLAAIAIAVLLMGTSAVAQQRPQNNQKAPARKPAAPNQKPATTTQKPVVAAQKATTTAPVQRDLAALEPHYQNQVFQIIEFLELIFNELGSKETPLQDKEEIIRTSYLKVFRDDKVQVEDDLDTRRATPTNKNVQSYLKDIDFFFRQAEFKLTHKRTEQLISEQGIRVVKVTLNRQLTATLLDGSTIAHNQLRYIEMNIDSVRRELKIASIYTNRLDEAQELQEWWASLSPEWKKLVAPQFEGLSEVSLEQLRTITQIEALDLSAPARAGLITSFDPLTELTGLRSLKLAQTHISDLWPLRNLSRLQSLDISGTQVSSLDPLKYLSSLQQLNLAGLAISDLSPLSNLLQLQQLNISGTRVSDWEALAELSNLQTLQATNLPATSLKGIEQLKSLQFLDVSNLKINNITPLAALPVLERVYLDNTEISTLGALRGKSSLQLLSINGTRISSLSDLGTMPALERIYADGTPLTREEINRFIAANPKCLVMNNSDAMASWWEQLPRNWRNVIVTYVRVHSANPSREQLAQMARLTEIDITGKSDITSLEPLKALRELKQLKANGTGVSSLAPLQYLDDLQHIECRSTSVSDLTPLAGLKRLTYLDISGTKVASLTAIQGLPELAFLYADNTSIEQAQFATYIDAKPERTVIFMTRVLENWWALLTPEWKQIFRQAIALRQENPTTEHLHQMAKLHMLNIPAGTRITSLAPVEILFRLHEFNFSNTQVQDLSPLSKVRTLRVLRLPNNPIRSLSAIYSLNGLEVLDIQSTPIEKIEEVLPFVNLRELNISGTPIRRLRGIEQLQRLERLSFFSTAINNIKPLESLPNLKKVQCYRTRLSPRAVENFRRIRPGCEVEYY